MSESSNTKIVKRKKLSFKKILIILLLLYIVGCFGYYLISLPIKNIYISGTTYLSDAEIIEVAGIKDYPPLLKTTSSKLTRKIKSLELVKDIKIKKNIWGQLTILITENKILFYNKGLNKIILENQTTSDNFNYYYGIPTLINYVPSDIYEKLIGGFSEIDTSTLRLISELEYAPIKQGDIIIDDLRFLLRMNDGNHVYINVLNIKKFNDYPKMYSSFGDKKGTLYLDSNIPDTSSFRPFSTEEKLEDIDEEPEN